MPASFRTAIRNGLVTTVLLAACAQDRAAGPSGPTLPKSLGPQAGYYYGDQGCTPGYWKTHTTLDPWYYLPGQNVGVFDVPDAFGLDDVTLLEALSLPGGPGELGAARILLRAAVAALLNAASPTVDYPLLEPDVISLVNAALASGDRDTMLDLAGQLDDYNNLGCPL
jgi:hypothetical protein